MDLAQHSDTLFRPLLCMLLLDSPKMNLISDLIVGFLHYVLHLNIHVCLLPTTSVPVGLSFWVSSAWDPPRDRKPVCPGPSPAARAPNTACLRDFPTPAAPSLSLGSNTCDCGNSFHSYTPQRPHSGSQTRPALGRGCSVSSPGACLPSSTPGPRFWPHGLPPVAGNQVMQAMSQTGEYREIVLVPAPLLIGWVAPGKSRGPPCPSSALEWGVLKGINGEGALELH